MMALPCLRLLPLSLPPGSLLQSNPLLGSNFFQTKVLPKEREERKSILEKPLLGKLGPVILGLEEVENFKDVEVTFLDAKAHDSNTNYSMDEE
jgi:hypothetical protein